jgi:hypothetical protein
MVSPAKPRRRREDDQFYAAVLKLRRAGRRVYRARHIGQGNLVNGGFLSNEALIQRAQALRPKPVQLTLPLFD